MMKKFFGLLVLLLTSIVCSQGIYSATPPLYCETPTFCVFCEQVDQAVADLVLQKSECYVAELLKDFRHTYSARITFEIYPNIDVFHKEMGCADGPQWSCGQADPETHTYRFVSPNNPGTYHTFDSIMSMVKVGLAVLFMGDAYKKPMPRWLIQGAALYKADFSSIKAKQRIAKLAQDPSQLPTLAQLSPCTDNDEEFSRLDGFVCSCTLVEFIDSTRGWETVLELLANPESLERILGISQEQFHRQWAAFLVQKYGK